MSQAFINYLFLLFYIISLPIMSVPTDKNVATASDVIVRPAVEIKTESQARVEAHAEVVRKLIDSLADHENRAEPAVDIPAQSTQATGVHAQQLNNTFFEASAARGLPLIIDTNRSLHTQTGAHFSSDQTAWTLQQAKSYSFSLSVSDRYAHYGALGSQGFITSSFRNNNDSTLVCALLHKRSCDQWCA